MRRAFVVGAGRIAAALLPGLRAAGWDVSAHARSAAGRAALRRLRVPSRPLARAADAELVFLAVPDAELAAAAAAVAPFAR
ncbi:MAG TPA: NAD(P)-binding domain-containing protein, partial [Anaeromyxobacteraceae bacterium]|nr:NAD(P)-binding domain-containing protein [Anaeromyxobacteraceae bacterium]